MGAYLIFQYRGQTDDRFFSNSMNVPVPQKSQKDPVSLVEPVGTCYTSRLGFRQ